MPLPPDCAIFVPEDGQKAAGKAMSVSKQPNSQLQKLERILTESGYVVRYERGNFQSGYCILEQRKVVVLNKFLQPEGRITTLMDLIPLLQVSFDELTGESQKLYLSIVKEPAV
jgi:hypothetical protein